MNGKHSLDFSKLVKMVLCWVAGNNVNVNNLPVEFK